MKDIVPGGWRLGGTSTYAALQAARLGRDAAVVTGARADVDLTELRGARAHVVPGDSTTTFQNLYGPEGRRQFVRELAPPLGPDDVPVDWRRAPVVLLGPVCGEVPPAMAALFEGALLGVSAQGWLRRVGEDQLVGPSEWPKAAGWGRAQAIFASEEDIAGEKSLLSLWTESFEIVALTRAGRGAEVWSEGAWRKIDAFPQDEVDPTGAGDIFAAAFLVLLAETGDVPEAARFASAAASVSVGAEGTDAVPERRQVEEQMALYPEVALR